MTPCPETKEAEMWEKGSEAGAGDRRRGTVRRRGLRAEELGSVSQPSLAPALPGERTQPGGAARSGMGLEDCAGGGHFQGRAFLVCVQCACARSAGRWGAAPPSSGAPLPPGRHTAWSLACSGVWEPLPCRLRRLQICMTLWGSLLMTAWHRA